jgi:carbamoyltransferase
MAKQFYIGLGVTYHDPALAIVDENGEVLFAEATERYLQYKRALNVPPDILYQLPELLRSHCAGAERFTLAFNWRPRRPLSERVAARLGIQSVRGLMRRCILRLTSPLENYKLHHMMACQRNSRAQGGLNLVRILRELYPGSAITVRDFDHHSAHAALACYGSPFHEAGCAVIDSYGENGSMAFFLYREGRLQRLREARGMGSLGFYFMKVTELCGFDWLKGEEWKVMGLAPYGRLDEQVYALLKDTLRVRGLELMHPRGSLFTALERLERRRRPKTEPAERAADLAYTGQLFFNETMAQILSNFHAVCGSDRLALAGGCALNSSFNGQILRDTPFCEVYVPPAPADDGTALGAAWLAFHAGRGGRLHRRTPLSPYLGSVFQDADLQRLVHFGRGLTVRHLPDAICEEAAELLSAGKLVAWVQGRAEFGPRALGNRSILADPRDPGMKEKINALVKFRENYRPFAPSILHEYGEDYFEDYQESPYMERALRFHDKVVQRVPAVVHVDGTGRLQSVKREWNPRFYRLIDAFHRRTGIPLLLNTSFNVMGRPIVHSVEDAIAVFMASGLDALVIGDHLFTKPEAVKT